MRGFSLILFSCFVGLVGLGIFVLGFGALVGANNSFGNSLVTWDTRTAIALSGLACLIAGRQLLILSRKLRAAAAVGFAWQDHRRPVVYLRCFSDDASGELTWLVRY